MHFTSSGTIFDKVAQAVEQTLYIEQNSLFPTTRLVDDLQLGRFGRIRLALYLEEIFEVEIADEAVECFDTIGDIVQYMSRWSLETSDASAGDWTDSHI